MTNIIVWSNYNVLRISQFINDIVFTLSYLLIWMVDSRYALQKAHHPSTHYSVHLKH